MIANKLAILEETETIKDGCCIPVLQDTETKRISYKNLKDSINNSSKIVKNLTVSVSDGVGSIKPTDLGLEKFDTGAIIQVDTVIGSKFCFVRNFKENLLYLNFFKFDSSLDSGIKPMANATETIKIKYIV